MAAPQISAIILAAGLSSRMGAANKLVLPINGVPIIECVVRTAMGQNFGNVFVVTGHAASDIGHVLSPYPVEIVFNARFDKGMGSSLIAGLQAARKADCESDGWLIWPGDMPFIEPGTLRSICNLFDPESIIVPTYASRRGHPVLFPAKFDKDLDEIPQDSGARSVLELHSNSVVELRVDDPGILRDIDRPEDLE
jgi:molybdenum cofactor cytidylyltransferase